MNASISKIAVIGLGNVGLPMSLLCLQQGFDVIGVDLKPDSVMTNIKNHYPELLSYIQQDAFHISSHYCYVKEASAVLICVPTPLRQEEPDLHHVTDALEALLPYLQPNQLIVLESSTYPGTTKKVMLPILEKSGLRVGKDIFVGYSPERIDPGSDYTLKEIPKLVSGTTNDCLGKISTLYSTMFSTVIPVSSTEIAEMTKLLENSYRLINISFINELAILCDALQLDIWEVIDAAKTKPFGFAPFYPGAGIGGHCIPVDPLYLNWIASKAGKRSKFIEAAKEINGQMAQHIVSQLPKALSTAESGLKDTTVLVIGVTYKKDYPDIKGSTVLDLFTLLQQKQAVISYHDPYVPLLTIGDKVHYSTPLTVQTLASIDCVLIHTDHSSIPIHFLLDHAKVIYDTKNVTKNYTGKARVFRMGSGENQQDQS